ncbi:hypothetical protein [Thermicanus aegyptius]|uniref:hypothetical protein n=1 Tax=Thermicanus aegyptius TaxID=94009 RepID=UPI000424ECAE|nr:hypothetical protein [Thermicanus aegyptius]
MDLVLKGFIHYQMLKMRVKEIKNSKKGDIVEKALIILLIALAAIPALTGMGSAIVSKFEQLKNIFLGTSN